MDRRQRRTREAIFNAFTALLSHKDFSQITVGEIIDRADIGRATFYSHFETKDYLLKELCQELFCHVFDAVKPENREHKHIFHCEAEGSVFLHLLQHLHNNDHHILKLLAGQRNPLFIEYFRSNLRTLVADQLPMFAEKKDPMLPESFWINHITATFIETVWWWIDNGLRESPEVIAEYFYLCL